MITEQFTLTVGVVPGYFHDNQIPEPPAHLVARLWQEKAEEVFGHSRISVGASVQTALTVYRLQWGCPAGGEETCVVTGLRNPEFIQDAAGWCSSVREVAIRVARALGQKTAYLTFQDVDFIYLKPQES